MLKEGPKQRKWLRSQLCPKIMSTRKLDSTLKELSEEGKLEKQLIVPKSGRPQTWYMLPGHRYLLDVYAAKIIRATKRLKPLLLRMPTVDEVAIEAGITPSEAEQIVYKLATQTGWYNPTPEIIIEARQRLGEILVCAARIKQKLVAEDGQSKDFNYDEDAAIVEEAKRFIKDYPKLLPKLTSNGEGAVWNQEALRFIGENYVPEDRSRPYGGVIFPGH